MKQNYKNSIENQKVILNSHFPLKGETLEENILFWTKEISLPHFNRYRVRFRKVFSWKIRELSAFNEKKRCIRGSKQTFDHSDTFY